MLETWQATADLDITTAIMSACYTNSKNTNKQTCEKILKEARTILKAWCMVYCK